MNSNLSVKLPAYAWVNTPSGKLVVMLAATTGMLEGFFNQFFARWGLTETKFNALVLLYKKDGMALWELGEEMLVSRANITGLMDRLERRGLVTREINPDDRRSLTARLTTKARQLVEEILPELDKFNNNVMKGLDGEEKLLLLKLLKKLQDGALKERE
ncbi:MAG: MarR family winged helix-turn-helix transcriptional regulator [Bacillota bacterium]|jgi:MarR family 2-MHQ and catechol resistance regulon transcriptional repressor|nr:MarR family transcriptional regulator [Clostridia bacterium]